MAVAAPPFLFCGDCCERILREGACPLRQRFAFGSHVLGDYVDLPHGAVNLLNADALRLVGFFHGLHQIVLKKQAAQRSSVETVSLMHPDCVEQGCNPYGFPW